jgi:hypothetical protein
MILAMSELVDYGHDTHPVDTRPEAAIFLGDTDRTGGWFGEWRKAHYQDKWQDQQVEVLEPVYDDAENSVIH